MNRVIFRKWKSDGSVIAFFIDQPQGAYFTSYEHIGQHGLGTYPHPQTLPATPEEYAPLLAELQAIGYSDIKPVTRLNKHSPTKHAIRTHGDLVTAIKKLVDYNWVDERRDYVTHKKEPGHIWETIDALNRWVIEE